MTDSEPNLIHMQARHYDPTLGRFIKADTMMLASITTQGMDRCSYTENDPVNATDPTGRSAADWIVGGALMLLGIAALIWAVASLPVVAGLTVASLLLVASFGAWLFLAASLFFSGLSLILTDANKRCLAMDISDKTGVISTGFGIFGIRGLLRGGLWLALRNVILDAAPG